MARGEASGSDIDWYHRDRRAYVLLDPCRPRGSIFETGDILWSCFGDGCFTVTRCTFRDYLIESYGL